MKPPKKRKLIWLSGSLVMLLGLSTAVMLRQKEPQVGVTNDSLRYVKSIYPPTTLDPKNANDVSSISVNNLIYSGLIEFGSDLSLKSDLAENFRTSTDGRALFFTLRRGLKFHNGTSVTTRHVVASLSRLMLPTSRVYGYYDSIEGAKEFHSGKACSVSGLVAASDHDLVIRLKYPFAPFLSILAGATAKVLPVTDPRAELKDLFKHPVGTGPFKFEKADKEAITLVRFENYHGIKPRIATLVLDHSPQPIAMKRAVSGGVHDLISWGTMNGKEDVFNFGQYVQAPIAETWIVGLNLQHKPFDDISVRRAFRSDFPSEGFRQEFFPDMEKATGYVPPLFPGHLKLSEKEKLDAEQRQLPKETSDAPISIAMIEGLNRAQEMKSFIENAMKSKGWNVQIVEMPWPKLMDGYNKKKFQSFIVSMNMDYPDSEFLFRNFESSNIDNFSSIRSKKIDRLIIEGRKTPNRIQREKIYHSLSVLVAQEAVTVDILHARGHYWLHPCVRGFQPSVLSYVYTDYRTIELDAKCLREKEKMGAI